MRVDSFLKTEEYMEILIPSESESKVKVYSVYPFVLGPAMCLYLRRWKYIHIVYKTNATTANVKMGLLFKHSKIISKQCLKIIVMWDIMFI